MRKIPPLASKQLESLLSPISEIKPFPKNYKEHPQSQVSKLCKSLRAFGWTKPVCVNINGEIVAGHGMVEAAKEEGYTHIPVLYVTFDENQTKAYVVADNRLSEIAETNQDILSELLVEIAEIPDFDIEAVGFSLDEIDLDLEPKEVVEDEFNPDDVKESRCKEGDLWQLGRHRLLCGSSTNENDIDKLMDGNEAELLFTSPPYADMREYNGNKDLSVKNLSNFIPLYSDYTDYQVVNLGLKRSNNEIEPYWDEYIKKARKTGYKFLSWNIWKKPNAGSIANQTAMFPIEHEWIFVFGEAAKELNKTIKNKNAGVMKRRHYRKEDGTLYNGEFRPVKTHRPIGSVIEVCQEVNAENNRLHPAMFPVELPSKYIEAMTDPNENVIEPFGGSGTTLIACEQLNRNCFIMELDSHYSDIIISRWEQFTGKTAEKLN